MSRIAAKTAWFGIIGVLSTLIYGATALLAINLLSWSPLVANATAYLAAMVNSYFGHRLLTFRATVPHQFAMPRFAAQSAFGYVLSHAITFGVARLDLHYLIGIVAVMVVLPAANFLAMQFWVFADRLPAGTRIGQTRPRR
jgi:putative flippase GtrA